MSARTTTSAFRKMNLRTVGSSCGSSTRTYDRSSLVWLHIVIAVARQCGGTLGRRHEAVQLERHERHGGVREHSAEHRLHF